MIFEDMISMAYICLKEILLDIAVYSKTYMYVQFEPLRLKVIKILGPLNLPQNVKTKIKTSICKHLALKFLFQSIHSTDL